MSLLNTVKTAKRIRHNDLNTEIERLISVARDEMVRAGIDESKANDENDSLTTQAVVTFCLYSLAETEELEGRYLRSWEIQLDSLRKSRGYKCTTTS